MKKPKTCLIGLSKICLIWLVFFVLSPSLKAQATFNDTANINMGIKLELGTVSLATKETSIVNDASFTEGEYILIASSKLVNNGSLSAKLAYKIDITKENGEALTLAELKDSSVIINFGTVAKEVTVTAASLNTNFTFVKDASNKEVIMNTDKTINVPVKVKYKSSIPIKKEKLTVKVTFKMIQSNAADANAEMFSDEEVIENVVLLVPKVIEEKKNWPAADTFVKTGDGKLSYSLEKMNMVFSEVYDKNNTKQIKNLNRAVLYIQLPEKEELKTTDYKTGKQIDKFKLYSTTANGKGKVNVDTIELDEKNHGYKVTFSLSDTYDSLDPNKVQEYTKKSNYQLHQTFQLHKYTFDGWDKGNYNHYADISLDNDIYASRLVLSSDIPSEINEWNFEQKKILLSTEKKSIIIKQLKGNSHWVKKEEFENIVWDKEFISLEVIESDNTKFVSYLFTNNNKPFSLWLNPIPSKKFNNATLNVKILGDAGNTLVISRTLENGINYRSMDMRSVEVPKVEKEAEIQADTNEGGSASTVDSSVPNEPVVDVPLEEVVEENPMGETEEIVEELEEAIEPSSAESTLELKDETTVTKEESNQDAH